MLEMFRGGDIADRATPTAARLDEVLEDIDETLRSKGRAVTLEELSR